MIDPEERDVRHPGGKPLLNKGDASNRNSKGNRPNTPHCPIINVTKELLAGRFQEYNRKYFGGALGRCRFLYLNTDVFGKYIFQDNVKDPAARSRIIIAKNVSWTEEALEEILVHEMVHMYVATILGKEHDGILGHGRRFRRECRRIKREHGLEIRIHPYHLYRLRKDYLPKTWEKVVLWLIDW